MNGSVYVATVSFLFCLARLLKPIQGGFCWTNMNKNGRCVDLLLEKISREECCRQHPGVETAWSEEDMDSGSLFFYRVVGGGIPCYACKDSCSEVVCGPGKKCVIRSGRPKCVCAPDCKEKGRHIKGPVCGTDGRSYRNVCRLKKRACRRPSSSLTVAYHGYCQSSCEKIQCPTGKYCLLDQNLSPHCVRCSPRCPPKTPGTSRQVCGADGITYQSDCHLREAACKKGKAIPIAYKGRCKDRATCGSVRCKARQSCLTDLATGLPRCVTCGGKCPKPDSPAGMRRDMGGPICGSNNITYHSWCHMIKDSCATGFVIDTKFSGRCEGEGRSRRNNSLDEFIPR